MTPVIVPAAASHGNLSRWREYQSTPWARLHYRISQANLDRHLPQPGNPLHILDVGGGSGVDAITYAGRGHIVTLTDPSSEMLEETNRSAQEAGVAGRITCCQADASAVADMFSEPTFDIVLCHNVIQYIEDVVTLLRSVCHPLRPGGLLSLIGINRYSEPLRQALLWLDLGAALENLDSTVAHSSIFDTPMRPRTACELVQALESVGCSVIAQYGIRCVNDYIPNNQIKADPAFFAELEQLECALSARYPYYLVARSFHIIACKMAPVEGRA